jgi:ribosome modulation factor
MTDKRRAAALGERCFVMLKGVDAFRNGLTPVDCPYALGTNEQTTWLAGWRAAFERKFNG